MIDRYPLEGALLMFADDHVLEERGFGCTCGFCVWSPQHVAVMAYRDAVDRFGPTGP